MASFGEDSILCDSSSLISLTDSCFVHSLFMLKEHFSGDFLISRAVEDECVNTPLKMKMHAIHALRLKRALNSGVVKVINMDVRAKAEETMQLANSLFLLNNRPMRLIHIGEAELLALSSELGIKNMLIDERTTRMLIESPLQLRSHLEDEFKGKIEVDKAGLSRFEGLTRGMVLFRSTEMLIAAYEHGYFRDYGEIEKETLRAALYQLKFNGCSVGFGEIDDFMRVIA